MIKYTDIMTYFKKVGWKLWRWKDVITCVMLKRRCWDCCLYDKSFPKVNEIEMNAFILLIVNLFLPGYKGDEMMFTDEQRKRGVREGIKLWKKNGIVRIPYVISSSSKEISLRRNLWQYKEFVLVKINFQKNVPLTKYS